MNRDASRFNLPLNAAHSVTSFQATVHWFKSCTFTYISQYIYLIWGLVSIIHTYPLIVALMSVFKHTFGVSVSLEEEIKSFLFNK